MEGGWEAVGWLSSGAQPPGAQHSTGEPGQLLKGPRPGNPRHGAHLGHGEDGRGREGQEGSGEDAGAGWWWRGCGRWAAAPGGHGLHGGMSPTPACV